MKSCIYCQHIGKIDDDELYDTRKAFIERPQMRGKGINIPIKEGALTGEMNISLDITLEEENNEPTLNCNIWEAYSGDDIFKEGKKINYCPMCGRKLNG